MIECKGVRKGDLERLKDEEMVLKVVTLGNSHLSYYILLFPLACSFFSIVITILLFLLQEIVSIAHLRLLPFKEAM